MIFLFFADLFEELKHLDIFLADLYKWVDILNTYQMFIKYIYNQLIVGNRDHVCRLKAHGQRQ